MPLLFAFCIYNCSNLSEDDFINDADDPSDPNEVVNYTDDIQPIIQSACIGCHASPPVNGAPFSLINFNDVNQRANGIISRMSLQSGSAGAMPPSGRLPQSTINKVQQWIDDGKLEN